MKYTLYNVLFPTKAKELTDAKTVAKEKDKIIEKLKTSTKKKDKVIEELTKETNRQLARLVKYERKLETLMYTNEEYHPDKIVDLRNGKYCIQWKPTWEPVQSEVVRLNPRLVEEFNDQRSKR